MGGMISPKSGADARKRGNECQAGKTLRCPVHHLRAGLTGSK